jgi:hypothetical protein
MHRDSHDAAPFPRFRHATRDVLAASSRKHMIHAMIEADVTDARSALRAVGRSTGEAPSLTGLIIACCARAVERAVDGAPAARYLHRLRRQVERAADLVDG